MLHVTLVRLAGDVVFLADELVVVQHIQLLARAQLLAANHAREAVEVEHLLTSLAHQVAGRDALRTTSALGSVPPASRCNKRRVLEPQWDNPLAAKSSKTAFFCDLSDCRVLQTVPLPQLSPLLAQV